MEPVDKPGTFDQKGIENIVAAAKKGFCIALPLGDDEISAVQSGFGLRV
jgi:hypothetical protein